MANNNFARWPTTILQGGQSKIDEKRCSLARGKNHDNAIQ